MKKKSKKKTVITLCLIIPIIVLAGAVLGTVMPLVISYQKNAYEKAEIVERSEEYVMPEKESQPAEWEDVTISEDELGKDYTEPETLAKDVNNTGSNSGGNSSSGSKYNYANSFARNANAISVYGKTPIYKVEKKDPNVENILILGTDSRDVTKERGRSDAIIIVSYNRRTGSVKMISVLRDSLVPIEGHRWNRINAAYSFDGVGLAINTINQIFDLDIQRFAVVDFNGVKDFINKVGGVDVTLTQAEADYFNRVHPKTNGKYEAGLFHMNGANALRYMRLRKLDSDFKRTERQRKVIEILANKIITEKTIPEIYDLIDFAFGLVKTNISLSEITSVATSVATNAMRQGLDLESQHVPYSDAYTYKRYNGMAIISFDTDDAARRINEFIYG
ncbi:MAG: LCP family protein [Clostridia bacterium]|nr:LCP family protein [Clostridia bacterium]MBQ4338214.1 LCP family protein [Clostridia bacterium]